MTKTTIQRAASRRRFLAAAAATGAATFAAPAVVRAQSPIKWKFQSTWPNRDIFHEFAQDFVNRVNAMAAGRLELEILSAGAVVPAFQLIDAVSAGILDGGHGVTAYWYGKNKAASLFGTAPAFGWTADQYLGWMRYGGGEALYEELYRDVLKVNVVGMQYGPMPTQPFGWFRKDMNTADDLRGVKYRTVGLAADLFRELGSAVTILPGGEIVPAMDRGLIDGAEFNNPSSDLLLGFPDVSKRYYVQSFHQALECFELLFNKRKFDALPNDLKAILRTAADASSADMAWKAQDRYSKDIEAIKARGVQVIKTPEPILKAQLAGWTTVLQKLSAENPFFKKVSDSQSAWAKRVAGFYFDYEVDNRMAYNHFFKS